MRVLILFLFFNFYPLLSTESDITVGTLNIKWLGDGLEDKIERSKEDYLNIGFILEELDIDILALQEIENEQALELITVFSEKYNYYLSPTPEYQKVAFLVKKDIEVLDFQIINKLKLKKERLRPGIVLHLKKNNFDFLATNIHFKSTSRYDDTPEKRRLSFYIRKQQSKILNDFLEKYSSKRSEEDILILGDFNDNPNKKYSNIKLLENTYFFLTKDITSCKNYLWTTIDHIAISKSLKNNVKEGPFMLDLTSAFDANEIEFISDHCPVLVKLNMRD